MHKYVIGTLFKHLYAKVDKKPQVFIFFDSIDEIKEFHDYFKTKVTLCRCRPQTLLQTKPNIFKVSLWA
jgi:hypothetical protein